MHIVQYMKGFRVESGGVMRAVLDLGQTLAAHGHVVTLVTFDRTDVPTEWSGRNGTPSVMTIRKTRRRLERASAARLRETLARTDVLHLHVPWDPVCVQLGRLARVAAVPYVLSIHGMLDDWCMAQSTMKKRLYLALGGRRLLERAGGVHCTAQAEAQQSSKWYPRGRASVVPLIFDLAAYEQLPGPQLARDTFAAAMPVGAEPVVLFLSRLHPKKRPELLIEAAAHLRKAGVPCRLLIAGAGEPAYEQQLRQLVARRDLNDHVKFVGFVSGAEKLSLYQVSDVFALPTHQENWGFVLVESLACGVPVVTTTGVDIWSELESSGGAVVADAEPARLAEAIGGLLADPQRRREMGVRGRAWVLDSLHPDRVISRYADLYRSVVEAGPGQPRTGERRPS